MPPSPQITAGQSQTPAAAVEPDQNPKAAAAFGLAQIFHGGVWSLIGYATAIVIRFGSTLILTRILAQEFYGVMAIVTSVQVALSLFTDIGANQSILQNPRGAEPGFRATAWTMCIARGVVMAALTAALAPAVAHFYPDYEGLTALLQVSAFNALIGSLASTSIQVAHRQMRNRSLVLLEVAASAASTISTIAVAMQWPSPWALVIGSIVGMSVRTIASHTCFGWSDRLAWDWSIVRSILAFTRWIFVSTILTFLTMHTDRLLIGLMVASGPLGTYNVALSLAMIGSEMISRLVGGVAVPIVNRTVHHGGDIEAKFLKARRPALIIGGWILSGLCGGGPALVALLYPERWSDAGWILQLIGVSMWVSAALDQPRTTLLLLMGRTRLMALTCIPKLVALAVAVPLGFQIAGLPGVLGGYAITEAVKYLATASFCRKSGVSGFKDDFAFTLIFALAFALAMCSIHIGTLFGMRPWLQCVAVFAVVTVVWAPLGYRIMRQVRDQIQ